MEINFNNIGRTNEIGAVGGAQQLGGVDKINTVFGVKKGDFVAGTPFNREEQHILGIFASSQDLILNED